MRHDTGNGIILDNPIEPIYGDMYLPRKFKIAVTVPGDNSLDIYINDIGVVVMTDEATGELKGFNVMAGGGMGRTHGKETTFARAADHLGFFTPDQVTHGEFTHFLLIPPSFFCACCCCVSSVARRTTARRTDDARLRAARWCFGRRRRARRVARLRRRPPPPRAGGRDRLGRPTVSVGVRATRVGATLPHEPRHRAHHVLPRSLAPNPSHDATRDARRRRRASPPARTTRAGGARRRRRTDR